MDPFIFPVLRQLNNGCFKTGKSISQNLGISSQQFQKTLKDARLHGIDIQGTRGHGYQWINCFSLLDEEAILLNVDKPIDLWKISVVDSLSSTNSYLLGHHFDNSVPNVQPTVLTAEIQTSGRGRNGRTWHSGPGENLLFSLAWNFRMPISKLSGLSLVIGIAIIRALQILNIEGVKLKWPNDVVYCSKKLGGVLIETKNNTMGYTYVVIGVGINVKLSSLTRCKIKTDVTDLFRIAGYLIDRNRLLAALLTELRQILSDFEQFGFAVFKDEWMAYHAFNEQSVKLTISDKLAYQGVIDSLNDDGSLVLSTATGKHCFNIGEVSLRAD